MTTCGTAKAPGRVRIQAQAPRCARTIAFPGRPSSPRASIADPATPREEALEPVADAKASSLRSVVLRMRRGLEEGRRHPDDAEATYRILCDDTSAELDCEMLTLLETGALRNDAATLSALRTSMDRFHHQLRHTRYEIDLLLPWLALKDEPAAKKW